MAFMDAPARNARGFGGDSGHPGSRRPARRRCGPVREAIVYTAILHAESTLGMI
jgi:hypothetical protein